MNFDPDAVREFERAGWNRAAERYESAFGTATRQFIPALLDAAGVTAGLRVLDVACGPGIVTAAAAQRGATVTGLDFSPAMLATARANRPGLTFDHGDAESLPYPDSAFDAVVSNFGIHHVPRPDLALSEAFRVLRSGGRLAFTIWAAPAENAGWKLLFDAIARFGNASASTAPAPGGGFSSGAQCLMALQIAGFADTSTTPCKGAWHHANATALVSALQAGTARMAALIASQDPAVLPAIVAEMDATAAPYRTATGISVPIAAVVASGVKR